MMIMLKTIRAKPCYLVLYLILFVLAGCGVTSPPSHFYVLSPMAEMATEQKKITDSDSISISIGPVSLPKYLKKQQIVTRSGSNELQLAEFDRWAGKIEEDIGRVIAENLAYLLSTDRVLSYPAIEAVEADYTIAMDISRFDGNLEGNVELIARWAIFDVEGKVAKGLTATRIIEPVQGNTYADMVAAQSRALGALSRELGDAVKHLMAR
jgi:uncharacterized lipoprotein YmbA